MAEPSEPRSQLPWHDTPILKLPQEGGFAPQEHWAWARIVRGETADMRFFPKDDAAAQESGRNGADDGADDDPKAGANWPAHRNLSARFIRTILFCEPWASARARPFVRIRCARFQDELDWETEKFDGELGLYSCLFGAELNWRGLHIGRLLNLSGSRLEGALAADRLTVDGALFCRDGFSVKGDIRLLGAHVKGQAAFDGAKLEGALSVDGLTVDGDLFCDDGFSVKNDISLVGALVKGDAEFSGAELEGMLRADGLVVDGKLSCRNGFSAKGDIRLLGAHVKRNASFVGARLEGALRADGFVVDGDCFLREMEKLNAANLLGARIGQDLQLSRSAIEGKVDLTGVEIKGELNLAQTQGPTWGEGARLVLRNARAGALGGGIAAFRRGKGFVSCDLAGFSYDRIGGIGAGAAGSTLASAKGHELRAWLKTCRPKDHYDPAPYKTLAKALTDAGRADRAADVRNALGNYELVARGTPLSKRVMLALSWLFIGYGERNHRAVMWFFALVLGAAGFGYWQDMSWLPAGPVDWSDQQAWLDWIGFAFGDAIPIVVFEKAHETFLADRFAPHSVPTGLTAFFYGVKIAGFVILSYLAAGLTGLAQRRD